MNVIDELRSASNAFLNFTLPSRCIICETEINNGLVCDNCMDYLPHIRSPFCRTCGRPVKKTRECRLCRQNHFVDRGRAWLLFIPPVDVLLHHYKYRKKTRLAQLFGRAMASLVRSDHELASADVIVPVPLYWWKSLQRGYNQAELLANVVSENCSLPVVKGLRRIKYTRTQTRLNDTARRQNVQNAFRTRGDAVAGKNVLLVDDVMTTGATITECARVLKEAGAAKVFSCVAAITP